MATRSPYRTKAPAGAGPAVSMQEVAAHAGVSRSAVSLALRGDRSIPPATRDRILAAARQLGYRTNPLVAALMSVRRSRAVGPSVRASLAFLTSHPPGDPWRASALYRRLHAAARARALELGFNLEEFSLADPALRPARVRELLRTRGIHGLLVAPLPGQETLLPFDVTDFAAVGLGLSVRTPAIDRVADDHVHATQTAFRRCRELGYRRIGLAVAAETSRRLEHRWLAGFLAAQQEVSARERPPPLMPETRAALPVELPGWIGRHRLDAVVFSLREEEKMAAAPAHVGLVSLSVHDHSGRVAGIRQDEARAGAEAVELLVEKLHHWRPAAPVSSRVLLVRGTWVDGLSAPGAGLPRQALLRPAAAAD